MSVLALLFLFIWGVYDQVEARWGSLMGSLKNLLEYCLMGTLVLGTPLRVVMARLGGSWFWERMLPRREALLVLRGVLLVFQAMVLKFLLVLKFQTNQNIFIKYINQHRQRTAAESKKCLQKRYQNQIKMCFVSAFIISNPFRFWTQLLPMFLSPLYLDTLFVYNIFSWVYPQSYRYLNSLGVTVGQRMAGLSTRGRMTLGADVQATLLKTYYFSALLQSQQSPSPSESSPFLSFTFSLALLGRCYFSTLNSFLNFLIIYTCSLSASPSAFLIQVLFLMLESLLSLLSTCNPSARCPPNSVHYLGPICFNLFQSLQKAQPASTVQARMLALLRKKPRAVYLLYSQSLKVQQWYLNILLLMFNILGSSLIWQQLVSVTSQSGPQVKMFRSEECPWRSTNKINFQPCSSFNFMPNYFRAYIQGFVISSQLSKHRFKSAPRKSTQNEIYQF